MADYAERLHARCKKLETTALVGLDPRWDLLPPEIQSKAKDQSSNQLETHARGFELFCNEIIEIVAPLVPAVKPQVAFFEKLGPAGMHSLRAVMQKARDAGLIVIADAKRGDIGSTAEAYADAWLAGEDPETAPYPADALTVNAYLGVDTLQPFVDACVARNAGIYVLVRTSNPGAQAFQDRKENDRNLFEAVADVVQQLNVKHWPEQTYGSIGAVVGATWPEELNSLRQQMPNVPLLVPGYGSQGGTAADVAQAFDRSGLGALINSSRGINFAFRNPNASERFGPENWRDAISAATHQMIVDLKQHAAAPSTE